MARFPRLVTAALASAALLAPAAQAAGPQKTAGALEREMRYAGAGSGAFVVDLDTGRPLYARAADTPRVPASVNKLYTTAAALSAFGAEGQLETTVLGSRSLDANGRLRGRLYLRGGGDPSFDAAAARSLARVLARSGLTEVTGRVVGDESYFDGLRGGPASSYETSVWVGPLSALTYGGGRSFPSDPARHAAEEFTRALERAGVDVRRSAGTGVAPPTAVTLGEWASPDMEELVARTNVPSDNFMAETLLKALGAEFGGSGSTATGAAVAREAAAAHGAAPRMVDGSGLSRGNLTTPRDVVELLAGMAASEHAEAFERSLPVAGASGTLEDRMESGPAAGDCRAKTGTLTGISALAGYCDGRGGSRVAFAFLMTDVSILGAHRLQDRMAAALARYRSSRSR